MEIAKALSEAWEKVRHNLCAHVGVERFRRWLECLVPMSFTDDVLRIGAPNRFILEWVEARYTEDLKKAIAPVLGREIRFEFAIAGELFRQARSLRRQVEHQAAGAAPPKQSTHSSLESFVPGAANRSAYRAVQQLLQDQQVLYNPLVVFGSCGTGKTHLLRGLVLAHRHSKRRGSAHYASAYDFAEAFTSSLRQKKVKRFRSYYRSLDLLALDDFQALSGKARVQEEFLHTFDALVNRGARVVVATTMRMGDIRGLKDRLRQRLMGGLLVHIRQPDFRTRLSIVRGESVRMRHALCEDVMEFLARHVRRNVRELLGAVTRLSAYAALEGRKIGVAEAQKLLADQLEGERQGDVPQRIIGAVCEAYAVGTEDLLGASRRRRIVVARKLLFYLLRTHMDLSLREIGELVGGRKAPTVRAAVRDVEQELRKGSELGKRIEALKRTLDLGRH